MIPLPHRRLSAALFMLLPMMAGSMAAGQSAAASSGQATSEFTVASPSASPAPKPDPTLTPSIQDLIDFKDSDIKFNLHSLMNVLRDQRHEGWVLAAYPDPNTSRPLIGAGFSLDVAAEEHPQTDALNPHLFIEPSTEQLWQAAGLNPDQLQEIRDRFDRNLKKWGKKGYQRKIRLHALPPDLTEEEATRLLRISTIQAVHNAMAYCRDFGGLTAAQQMAMSQLVFQMGVNLEEFVEFLGVLNGQPVQADGSQPVSSAVEPEADHWKNVQHTLIDSQWARRYSTRAATVIAMFDPDYMQDPGGVERKMEATLRPPAKHHHKKSGSSRQRRTS
jgi:hypothetical protein